MVGVTRMIVDVRDEEILFACAEVNVVRTICPHPSGPTQKEQ